MKNLISLLAVALLATTFAAGCGKLKACGDAGKNDCETASKFENNLTCKWDEAAKKCVAAAPKAKETEAEKNAEKDRLALEAEKAVCKAATLTAGDDAKSKTACETEATAKIKAPAKGTCKYTEAVAANPGANPPVEAVPAKCEWATTK